MNVRRDKPSRPGQFFRLRVIGLVAMALVVVVITLCQPPWPQGREYYNFADQRRILGVANFTDVVSNAPFALIGAMGLSFLVGDAAAARRGRRSRLDWQDRWTFGVMFAGVLLTAFGSGYFHLAPDNDTLFWDRMPMTIAFLGLFAGMIAERVSRQAGAVLLGPLVLFGMGTVIYWRWTESQGAGDLRFYMWLAQRFPQIALVYLVFVFRPRYLPRWSMIIALAWYVLAKRLEDFDTQIYAAGEIVSGHTLKHLAAAMGTYWILRAIKRNCQLPPPPNRAPVAGVAAQQPPE